MASLREIKDRIASVRSTLKITSAMKLVASSKLRRAQNAVETLRPYIEALSSIMEDVSARPETAADASVENTQAPKTAIVAVSSNSSLCGAFNANVIRRTLDLAGECDCSFVIPVGRKMADAVSRAGIGSGDDFNHLVSHPSYDGCSQLSERLMKDIGDGRYSRVMLVYNHFVSTGRQEVTVETFPSLLSVQETADSDGKDFIMEPGRVAIANSLLPKVRSLCLFRVLLDSVAAEQAARTVAMQTASDNASDLLSELTLEYNKGRQQKITAEILDLLGGASK